MPQFREDLAIYDATKALDGTFAKMVETLAELEQSCRYAPLYVRRRVLEDLADAHAKLERLTADVGKALVPSGGR